jgi:hypothetical protein
MNTCSNHTHSSSTRIPPLRLSWRTISHKDSREGLRDHLKRKSISCWDKFKLWSLCIAVYLKTSLTLSFFKRIGSMIRSIRRSMHFTIQKLTINSWLTSLNWRIKNGSPSGSPTSWMELKKKWISLTVMSFWTTQRR